MKKKKVILIIVFSFIAAIILAIAIPFTVLGIRTYSLDVDYAYLRTDAAYSNKVEITEIELVPQKISCGYATIEMMSAYYGDKVTEDDLSAKNNGAISTASSGGFLQEIQQSIPSHTFVKHSYLKHDALLKEIHDSLANHDPVAIEWAAQFEGEWTLHFSLVSGLDLSSDEVTIYNPYGYIENIPVAEFIARTSFSAYANMPLFLNFGFAFGAFEKNAIIYAQ